MKIWVSGHFKTKTIWLIHWQIDKTLPDYVLCERFLMTKNFLLPPYHLKMTPSYQFAPQKLLIVNKKLFSVLNTMQRW